MDCGQTERERKGSQLVLFDWGIRRPLTLHVVAVLGPCATPTHADGDADETRTDDKESTEGNQDEPREVEPQEPSGVLTLTQSTDGLVAAVRTVVDAIADEVRVDAESGQRAPEVLAGVLWKGRGEMRLVIS